MIVYMFDNYIYTNLQWSTEMSVAQNYLKGWEIYFGIISPKNTTSLCKLIGWITESQLLVGMNAILLGVVGDR